MLPKAESAPPARASFTSWGSMALTLVASPWNFKLDAVRFWCNLAWVGHISQAYLDYIGWPRNITRQMKVWRNSKRTQLNKENLGLATNLSCLLFETLHSVYKGWCFSLRPDQSAARGVSANFEVVKIVAKKVAKEAPLNDCYNSVLAPAPGLGEDLFQSISSSTLSFLTSIFFLEWQNLLSNPYMYIKLPALFFITMMGGLWRPPVTAVNVLRCLALYVLAPSPH